MGNADIGSFASTAKSLFAFNELEEALNRLYEVPAIARCITHEHVESTPKRVTEVFADLYSGCHQDPVAMLKTKFASDGYDEMVYVNNIKFVSSCAHHGLPFFGKAHFAYLPGKQIVGLSKIPRVVQILARRPQVQEKLTREIVDVFAKEMKPRGCGLVMEGYHLCMMIRGVKNDSAYTKTTALYGAFKKNASLKAEFLDGVRQVGGQVWP